MPRPKAIPEQHTTADPVPPGPIQLEVRVDGKIKFLQRVHSVHIDQQSHQAVITGALRPTIEVPRDSE
jgi:hypothetical protein